MNEWRTSFSCFALFAATFAHADCYGQSTLEAGTMNGHLVAAAHHMAATVAGRGYERRSSFSEPLRYGKASIQPSNQGKTMCVAAVAEAMIRAIDAHAIESGDTRAYAQLPLSHWTRGSLNSLRAHLYQYEGTGSAGPGDALALFGIGEKLAFEQLAPGDLLAFSRRKSGHAVVFLGYLDRMGQLLSTFDATRVAGFRYLSSQGEGLPVSGVGYRNAYFSGTQGPQKCDRSFEDCGVLRRPAHFLNGGRLWVPSRWDTAAALQRYKALLVSDRMSTKSNQELTRGAVEMAIDHLLDREMPETYSVNFE